LAENERTLALRGFTEQFYAARALAASAAARIGIAREGVVKAQDNLAASIARYRAGEAQIVEVTDAQTTLVEQRTLCTRQYSTTKSRWHGCIRRLDSEIPVPRDR
jgi:outer membrane protein TolC